MPGTGVDKGTGDRRRGSEGALPGFLILGAMKSGTTSLSEYLMAHPEAFLPAAKELAFFDRNWERGRDWYAAQFDDFAGQPAVGEATPTYLSSPAAPARIASLIPDAKLIAVLRNPVDRAYSHYWHERHRKDRERRGFPQAVEAELAAGCPLPEDHYEPDNPARFGYIARGRYLEQLQRFCECFPRESLLVLLLDELETEPKASFATVCRFIGIDPTIIPENVGGVANAYVEQRARPIWRMMSRHQLWRRMPPSVARLVAQAMVRTDATYEPMPGALRTQLTDYFEPHNAALGEWLGRDLSAWNEAPPPERRASRRSIDGAVQWWRRRGPGKA